MRADESPPQYGTDDIFEGIGWAVLSGIGFFWLLPHFSALALTWDASEYVYCIQHFCLPHAPYFLHFATGCLLSLFLEPDRGLSAVSFVSVLFAAPILGVCIKHLTGSRLRAFFAAMIFLSTPVVLLYSGIQEVYPFQFFWIVATWWAILRQASIARSSLLFALAVLTHVGTLLAMPATLWLLFITQGTADRRVRLKNAGSFLLRSVAPFILLMTLLVVGWIAAFGPVQGFRMGLFYWKGLSPSPNLSLLLEQGAGPMLEKIHGMGTNLTEVVTLGWALPVAGVLGLFLLPLNQILFWALLAVPYLVYEAATIGTVDEGIYLVFLVPALAAGATAWLSAPHSRVPQSIRLARIALFVPIMLGVLWNFANFQHHAREKLRPPENTSAGAAMFLSRWVENHSPQESVLINPLAWSFAPYAGAVYSHRRPVLSALGWVPTPRVLLPLYDSPLFRTLHPLNREMLESWWAENRTLLSFDNNPLTGFGFHWGEVDVNALKAEPMVWFDRNLSGSSQGWNEMETIARIELGSASSESRYDVELPAEAEAAHVDMPLYRPTLYRVVAATSETPLPHWIAEDCSGEQYCHLGAKPTLNLSGYSFGQTGRSFTFQTPVRPYNLHTVRLVMLSKKKPIDVECHIEIESEWLRVSRDSVYLMDDPDYCLVDLYFPIPSAWVLQPELRVKLTSTGEEGVMNAFLVEVGTHTRNEPMTGFGRMFSRLPTPTPTAMVAP
jgi:hypothetical protein